MRASCVVRLVRRRGTDLSLLRSCDTHVVGSAVDAYGIVCMYAVCTICTKADVYKWILFGLLNIMPR